MANILPLFVAAGLGAWFVTRDKKKKKKASEGECPEGEVWSERAGRCISLLEPGKTPGEITEEGEPTPSKLGCLRVVDPTLFAFSKTALESGRPMIATITCDNTELVDKLKEACVVHTEIDFMISSRQHISDPAGIAEIERICAELNGGGFIVVYLPTTMQAVDEQGQPRFDEFNNPVMVDGLRIYDWEDIGNLRFVPGTNTAISVINAAIDFAKGAPHEAAKFGIVEELMG